VAIFQPHTFSRTEAFLQDFADSLSQADVVFLCDIFSSAREQSGNLTIVDLKNLIQGSQILQLDTIQELEKNEQSVFLFMGAGDVHKFQDAFEEILKK